MRDYGQSAARRGVEDDPRAVMRPLRRTAADRDPGRARRRSGSSLLRRGPACRAASVLPLGPRRAGWRLSTSASRATARSGIGPSSSASRATASWPQVGPTGVSRKAFSGRGVLQLLLHLGVSPGRLVQLGLDLVHRAGQAACVRRCLAAPAAGSWPSPRPPNGPESCTAHGEGAGQSGRAQDLSAWEIVMAWSTPLASVVAAAEARAASVVLSPRESSDARTVAWSRPAGIAAVRGRCHRRASNSRG